MHPSRRTLLVACLLAAAAAATGASRPASSAPADAITIDRQPPTVHYATFANRQAPPATGEDAFCRSGFYCQVRLKYDTSPPRRTAGGWEVTARIHSVSLTLTLDDVIVLPTPTTKKLRAHEEGHRRINERIYADRADAAARAAAENVLSRTWRGTGATADAAGKAATDHAIDELGRQYLAAVADRAYAVGTTYDHLTDHGRNLQLEEDQAIQRACAAHSQR